MHNLVTVRDTGQDIIGAPPGHRERPESGVSAVDHDEETGAGNGLHE